MADEHLISPLAPSGFPMMPVIDGVRLSTALTGMKYHGRTDLLLVQLPPHSRIAGVFTRSKTASAPVDVCRRHLAGASVRAILVNAGNANAFTGIKGEQSTNEIITKTAKAVDCDQAQVFIASTGVIGEPLDPGFVTAKLDELVQEAKEDNWHAAAKAIMTTDTFAKGASIATEINGRKVTINGIAKGSGMIAPDMATMLVFIFCDAGLPVDVLQTLLERSVDQSFNCITVDSDTSTSDTVLLSDCGRLADDGLGGADDPGLAGFATALDDLTRNLAHQVVRDGEGAEKFITIKVTGAESDKAARKIGLSIANSPLVKTAIAGEDANWGRIVMAVGKAGEAADRDRLAIAIGGVSVAKHGQADPQYRESDVVEHMQSREIDIAVDVGVGDGQAVVWTCDLTHRYIEINADYRS